MKTLSSQSPTLAALFRKSDRLAQYSTEVASADDMVELMALFTDITVKTEIEEYHHPSRHYGSRRSSPVRSPESLAKTAEYSGRLTPLGRSPPSLFIPTMRIATLVAKLQLHCNLISKMFEYQAQCYFFLQGFSRFRRFRECSMRWFGLRVGSRLSAFGRGQP
jgi:hypothetical protein